MIKSIGIGVFLLFSYCSQVYAQSAAQITTLPITTNTKGTNKTLIFYLTGDGGMNNFSTKLIENLASQNFKVIALDSKKYFWEEKSPEKIGKELSTAIAYYIKQNRTADFILLGYSFGADASIFLAANLQASLNARLKGIILLSPSMATDLEVKMSDLIGFGGNTTGKYKTLPMARRLAKPIFCVAGADENNSFYNSLTKTGLVDKKALPGSHKYDNNVPLVASTVIAALISF